MKTTTFNSKCFSRLRSVSREHARHAAPAHVPARRHGDEVRVAPPEPGAAARHPYLSYVETPIAAPAPKAGAPGRAACGPRVLHVDIDNDAAAVLAKLLCPEAEVTHVSTLAGARRMLEREVFSLIVLDPALPDGDARALLPLLKGTPLLVYSAHQPEWRDGAPAFLPKPWTSSRQLWLAIAAMLGIAPGG